jgi:hypothetical protein
VERRLFWRGWRPIEYGFSMSTRPQSRGCYPRHVLGVTVTDVVLCVMMHDLPVSQNRSKVVRWSPFDAILRRWAHRVKINCGLQVFTFEGPVGIRYLPTFLVLKQDQQRFIIMAIGTEVPDFSENVFRFELFSSAPERRLPEWMTGDYLLIRISF